MVTLYTLVEGQTEERFFLATLRPHLGGCGVNAMPPQLVRTSRHRGTDFRGGVVRYEKVLGDIRRMVSGKQMGSRLTTMLDYYDLPADFPGRERAASLPTPQARVACIESAFAADVEAQAHHLGQGWFIPYIQLHEFEALVLVDPGQLARQFTERERSVQNLVNEVAGLAVEEINDGQDTAPSKRIIRHIPDYDGRKPQAGPAIAGAIGLDRLRASAPHFGAWLSRVESLT